MADIRQVTNDFAVAPQIDLDDFAGLAAMGYTHIINNRPDGEAPDQPDSDETEEAAKAAGLTYVHAPFVGQPTADAVKAVMQAKGKTLAFCRSGTRSVTAWAFAQATKGGQTDAIVEAAANAGYNLAPAAGLLKQLGAR
ncbi:MAG: TIGR01244 family sulfur transferase [Hyphomonadaceae bacterium]|nr:TIGR01244 family sulfur transferase [Hyphomonadaceae bacterium]